MRDVQVQSLERTLLSREDHTPIKLSTAECSKIAFEEIAVIYVDGCDFPYYILRPFTKMKGCSAEQGVVFYIKNDVLLITDEKEVVEKVFDVYYDLVSCNNFSINNSDTSSNKKKYKTKSFIKSSTVVKPSKIDMDDKYKIAINKRDIAILNDYVATLSNVEGQDNNIDAVLNYLYTEINKPKKGPRGSMLFVGPSGCGKTMLAKLIGLSLNLPTKFISMSGYADKEAVFDFAGIHKSYKGARAGEFTKFVKENPFSVVILDEIEKAHAIVIRLFLQALDQGYIRDAFLEEEISLKNSILIFTSNLGSEIYNSDYSKYNYSSVGKKEILEAISKEINPVTDSPYLNPAIVSRFSEFPVLLFNRLSPISAHKIVRNTIKDNITYFENKKEIKIDIDTFALASELIYSEGDTNDVRSLKERVVSYFNNVFINIDRDLARSNIELGYKKLDAKSDYENCSDEVKELVNDEEKNKILYVSSDSDDVVSELNNNYNATFISANLDFDALSTQTLCLDGIIIDNTNNPIKIKKLFDELVVREYSIPIYVINRNGALKSSFNYYISKGCQDIYSSSLNEESIDEWLNNIIKSLNFVSILNKLKVQRKCLKYDYEYSFNMKNKKATINYSNVAIKTCISSEDNKYFVPLSEMSNVKFVDIFGGDNANEIIKDCIYTLKNYQKYIASGVKIPKGILLYGEPGNGKTLRAKAIAIESGLPYMAMSSTDFIQDVAGEGAKKVKNVFSTLRKYGGVLFIDEFELLALNRENGIRSDTHEILNAFLSEMDGFSDNTRKPIFVVAATNFDASFGSNDLDPAVLRRFDYKIRIENPNKEERLDFINKLIEKSKITSLSSEMIESIAIRSNGWNYSDLTKLINEIKKKSIDLSSSNLTQNNNNELLNEIFESFTDGEHKKIKKTDLEHIAYHEAGHALVSYLLGKTPDYVTINSRGNYGGFVFNSYEGKFDFTKDEMLNQICITLAGRASEMAIFNDKGITTGASNDIRMANDLAKNMYNNYGMVEDNLYISDTKNLDKSAKEIISKLLKEEMTRANELITSNLDLLKIIANKLLNSGYITSLDFDNLMKGVA